MKIIGMAFLLSFQVSAAQPMSREWVVCAQDSDCVKVDSACGTKNAGNKNYQKEFTAYLQRLRPVINCIEVSAERKLEDEKSLAVCQEGVCTLAPPPAIMKGKVKAQVRPAKTP